MAKTPIRSILTIILGFAFCCTCQSNGPDFSSSWAKLQISPDPLSSMDYGNFLIEMYEHTNNHKATASDKKYFYSPIALLDHKTAVSIYNNVTKQSEMRFRIEMWNDKVQNKVVNHLQEIFGHDIKSNTVRVIPLEKVILTSNIPTADYSLSPVWTNYDRSKTLKLSLSCYDQKVCDGLANEMPSNPEQFDHLKILYSLSPQKSQTKQTTITIDSITSGQMVTTLIQKFGNEKEVFLTANDERKMLAEMATKIRMDTFDDYEVVSPDSEIKIFNILKDLLVTSKTTIKNQCDKMWDSVFWDEENYRPDKTTKTLNEIIKKLDTETQKKLADMFKEEDRQSEIMEILTSSNKDAEEEFLPVNQPLNAHGNEMKIESIDEEEFSRHQIEKCQIAKEEDQQNQKFKERIQHNYDLNSWVDVDKISSKIAGKMTNDSDSSRWIEILKGDVKKLLQESRDHVQWDGEKFVAKLLQLTSISLHKFRDSESFQDQVHDRNVVVRYTNAELSSSIKFKEHTESIATDEWNNLKDELRANSQRLGHELKIAEDKLRKELRETSSVKASAEELNNLRHELRATSNKLETTIENLASARLELSGTKSIIADLTTKLNNSTREIVDIGEMPTSCEDLQRIGHTLSGFFLVKGSMKMETVYCNFYSDGYARQELIGYADVKSTPVYFYVQRKAHYETHWFTAMHTPITYELTQMNEGNAMDLPSGKFTAPRPGIYFFSFTALVRFPSSFLLVRFGVGLYLNVNRIGLAFVEEYYTADGQNDQVTIQSTLKLKTGDQVWVQIDSMSWGVALTDYDDQYTHFTGFMLEEEIVASS
ncbi:uncharacterized protein LOC124336056 isoform X5 [Daphnia pulicaria]|uniref:uncharacterized protein LOC124336056 isoform X5 n=1 Tax=Daphnia pulicaria TaxID=35523 RepID=UPI001EEB01AD|nr:uncharacterized protein LOC124336056 isoform X5 [Daphnia pulicaria]